MAKQKRNIYQPITASDWFLYNLFNDEDFASIRKQWQLEINDVDQGPGQEAKQRAELEDITARYTKILQQKFDVTEETARKGLVYIEHNRTLNGHRVPVAEIQGDRVLISIGSSTRLDDVIDLWDVWISLLQSKLPDYDESLQKENLSKEPLLVFTVYKELRRGRTMVDVHNAYLDGTLHNDIPAGNKWLEISAFRKYYKRTVKGYINRP